MEQSFMDTYFQSLLQNDRLELKSTPNDRPYYPNFTAPVQARVAQGDKTVYSSGAVRDKSDRKSAVHLIDFKWLAAIENASDTQERAINTLAWELLRMPILPVNEAVHITNKFAGSLLNKKLVSDKTLQFSTIQLDSNLLLRLGLLLRFGANKYGDENWKKGAPLKETYQRILRHGMQLLVQVQEEGVTDVLNKSYEDFEFDGKDIEYYSSIENDHLSALLFNFMLFWHTAQHYSDSELTEWFI